VIGSAAQIIAVLGPTASGKTQVAAELAMYLGTEVVSADARQVYRELSVGVARPPDELLQKVPHHFIASHTIHHPLDAASYAAEARALIDQLLLKYGKVVLCGGSGLYIRALLEGFDDIPDVPPHIRLHIQEQYRHGGLRWLQQQMELFDAETLSYIDRHNPQRLMRALEVRLHTGKSIRYFQQGRAKKPAWQVIKIGLTWPREVLYQRINSRVTDMVNNGLFDEAALLYPHRHLTSLQTVGYQEVFGFLEGLYTREEAICLIQRNTRRYAKRQLTWFRRDAGIQWMPPNNMNAIKAIASA